MEEDSSVKYWFVFYCKFLYMTLILFWELTLVWSVYVSCRKMYDEFTGFWDLLEMSLTESTMYGVMALFFLLFVAIVHSFCALKFHKLKIGPPLAYSSSCLFRYCLLTAVLMESVIGIVHYISGYVGPEGFLFLLGVAAVCILFLPETLFLVYYRYIKKSVAY